jgi:hypothetical protein
MQLRIELACPQLLLMTACFYEASLNLQRKNDNCGSCFINDRFAKKMALCLREIILWQVSFYRQVAQIDSFHLREERLRERRGRLCCSPVLAVGAMLKAMNEAVGSLSC